MSCYFRHLNEIFAEAGIEVTPANRKKVDRAVKAIVGNVDDHCPEAWKKIKLGILSDPQKRKDFSRKLRDALAGEKTGTDHKAQT